MQTLTDKIESIIAPSLEADGFAVVQIALVNGTKRKTLQILAENIQTGRITLDECAQINRTVSALLDVEDVLDGAYNLEVSSPGIDRPLIKPADFERYCGFDAKIETSLPINGRRRFKGQLLSTDENSVTIRVDQEDHTLAFGNISNAKLILTDALIKSQKATQSA